MIQLQKVFKYKILHSSCCAIAPPYSRIVSVHSNSCADWFLLIVGSKEQGQE